MNHIQRIRFAVATLLVGLGIAHAQDSAVFNAQQGAW